MYLGTFQLEELPATRGSDNADSTSLDSNKAPPMKTGQLHFLEKLLTSIDIYSMARLYAIQTLEAECLGYTRILLQNVPTESILICLGDMEDDIGNKMVLAMMQELLTSRQSRRGREIHGSRSGKR